MGAMSGLGDGKLMDAFYFGCAGRVGHFLYNRQMRSIGDAANPTPWRTHEIDGELLPHDPRCCGPQGIAALHHKAGWTALSFCDRSIDRRNGSNSNFLLRGVLTFDEAVAEAKRTFPGVWARLPFAVVPCAAIAGLVAQGVA